LDRSIPAFHQAKGKAVIMKKKSYRDYEKAIVAEAMAKAPARPPSLPLDPEAMKIKLKKYRELHPRQPKEIPDINEVALSLITKSTEVLTKTMAIWKEREALTPFMRDGLIDVIDMIHEVIHAKEKTMNELDDKTLSAAIAVLQTLRGKVKAECEKEESCDTYCGETDSEIETYNQEHNEIVMHSYGEVSGVDMAIEELEKLKVINAGMIPFER
jgi:hypothetical protein